MDRYRKEKTLGRGAFGQALLVTDKVTNKKCVIKVGMLTFLVRHFGLSFMQS